MQHIEHYQALAHAHAQQIGFSPARRQRGFGELIGPFFECEGKRGLLIDERHINPEGFAHGGLLASAMDYALYCAIGDSLGSDAITPTVDMQVQYIGSVKAGDWLEGEGRILRETRSLVFVTGELRVAGELVMAGTAVYKKIAAHS